MENFPRDRSREPLVQPPALASRLRIFLICNVFVTSLRDDVVLARILLPERDPNLSVSMGSLSDEQAVAD
jgi:hypothetical protein